MDESTEETQARQAAALSGEIDQEVGENGVLVSGGGADARVLRSQEAPDAGAFRTPVAGGARRGSRSKSKIPITRSKKQKRKPNTNGRYKYQECYEPICVFCKWGEYILKFSPPLILKKRQRVRSTDLRKTILCIFKKYSL